MYVQCWQSAWAWGFSKIISFLWAQGGCICSTWQREAWPPLLCSDIMRRSNCSVPPTYVKVGKYASSSMGRLWRATKMHLVCIQKCVIPREVSHWYGFQSIFSLLLDYFFSCFRLFSPLCPLLLSFFPLKQKAVKTKAWAGFCPLQTSQPPQEPWYQNLDLEYHHPLYKVCKNYHVSDTISVWYGWGNYRHYIWYW